MEDEGRDDDGYSLLFELAGRNLRIAEEADRQVALHAREAYYAFMRNADSASLTTPPARAGAPSTVAPVPGSTVEVSLIACPNPNSGLPTYALAAMTCCQLGGWGPETSDEHLLKVPELFRGELPTLDMIESAYRYDYDEHLVRKFTAHWKALFESVERALARKRRVAARVPLLLCRQRYYDQREDDEVPDKDVIVQIAQPGIEGVFRKVAKFL